MYTILMNIISRCSLRYSLVGRRNVDCFKRVILSRARGRDFDKIYGQSSY